MKDLLNLFDEDNSIREFNFIILVVSLVIIARNYFRGNGFKVSLDADLFFEITLLMIPVAIFLIKHKTNKEIKETFKYFLSYLIALFVSIFYIIIGSLLCCLSTHFNYIDWLFSVSGILILILGIINCLVIVLMFIISKQTL